MKNKRGRNMLKNSITHIIILAIKVTTPIAILLVAIIDLLNVNVFPLANEQEPTNAHPGVQDEMFQNYQEGQKYVEEQYDPYYYAGSQGN